MPYRILSLDGGGTWALIQVKALMKIYGPDKSGHEVLREFDMAAANSGGSIVLGGLLGNLSLQSILALFQDEKVRQSIFSPTDIFLYQLVENVASIGPKYSAAKKLPALLEALPNGKRLLKEAAEDIPRRNPDRSFHVLIVGFDYDRNRAKYFRSAPASSPGYGEGEADSITVAEAIHASTNAPVNYFDLPAECRSGRYWDGAITGNNNPVLAGVTEAIVLGQQPENIVALSLGTAGVERPLLPQDQLPSPLFQPISKPGLKPDLLKLATAILDDPPNIAAFLAHVMTGGRQGVKPPADSRIVRMNPSISPKRDQNGQWRQPDGMTLEDFGFLAELDIDAVAPTQVEAISDYADLWLKDVAPNQPIRANGKNLSPELGQPTFSKALAAWNAIR